jgi:hypothetical protein
MFTILRRIGSPPRGDTGIHGAVSGTFDLCGNTLTGWVNKLPGRHSRGTIVEVMRRGEAIASCPAPWIDASDRLPFELPILERFTEEEIAREIVAITARTGLGHTGTLKMDGASQLALVRAYFGRPVETVFDLGFGLAGNARSYLGKGWCNAEEHTTWAEGFDSFIHFESPTKAGHYLLRLRFGAFITPNLPRQVLDIYLNEEQVAHLTTDQRVQQFEEIRIESESFGPASKSEFRLHYPNAVDPSLHIDCKRRSPMSFWFRSVIFVRVLDQDD